MNPRAAVPDASPGVPASPSGVEPGPGAFVPGRVKWWQWPTVLSLDAPAVTLVWQALIARVAEARLAGHHVLLLGLSVWLAYAADRWIEGWRLTTATVRTQRHYFHLRWRWPILVVWVLALIGGVSLALERFSPREWRGSLGLLIPTLAYLLSHQFIHRHHPWRVPKEVCVAAIIALGAALYPATLAPDQLARLAWPVMLFGGLGLANCVLISEWERDVDAAHRQTSLALRFPGMRRIARCLPAAIAASAVALATTTRGAASQAAWCAATSAALLVLLARAEPRLGRERARVLADVALLTPIFILFV